VTARLPDLTSEVFSVMIYPALQPLFIVHAGMICSIYPIAQGVRNTAQGRLLAIRLREVM
jgi:hypothetical protein